MSHDGIIPHWVNKPINSHYRRRVYKPFPVSPSVMSDSMIMDAIASCLVLPNRLVVPLVQGLHVARLRSPLPRVQ